MSSFQYLATTSVLVRNKLLSQSRVWVDFSNYYTDLHASSNNILDLTNKKHLKKCWAHSPLRAAARRLFYIAIHQVSLLSHAATVARRLRIDVHNNDDDNNNNNNDNAWQRRPLWPHRMGPTSIRIRIFAKQEAKSALCVVTWGLVQYRCLTPRNGLPLGTVFYRWLLCETQDPFISHWLNWTGLPALRVSIVSFAYHSKWKMKNASILHFHRKVQNWVTLTVLKLTA